MDPTFIPTAERRKQVKLRTRMDLVITEQRYEGRLCHVVKDPVSLKYYRFNQQEYYVFEKLTGANTLEDIRKDFEKRFAPDRLTLEDLEGFARQLVTAGLVHHDSPNAARELFDKRRKQRRTKRLATITNILYIKLPVFDPDRLLDRMIRYTRWIFTHTFLWLSVGLMLAAGLFVAFHYKTFYDKLPAYQEFFAFRTLLYMWIALGVVKVIHEFGHGLSCKAFGGESHEMGFLFMCFSPALYCNVTDSWTVADKWKRIVISFAGIWVELIIASIATFVWWYTPHWPFVNNVAMCLMVLCSVSTFVFNANPLMRFDGYYILADWLEVPNLRERSNRFLSHLVQEKCLGIEVQPEAYMAPSRKWLFVSYAIASFLYRWFVTISILFFLAQWLKPYKLETLSVMLALGALASMVFWPTYRMVKSIRQRGRLPDMKRKRVVATGVVLAAVLGAFFFLPLPVSRVREVGLVQVTEGHRESVFVHETGILYEVRVHDGQRVPKGADLGQFRNPQFQFDRQKFQAEIEAAAQQIAALESRRSAVGGSDPNARTKLDQDLLAARNSLKHNKQLLEKQEKLIADGEVLRAPRAGVVMSAPRKEDVFRTWEKGDGQPFCTIGEPDKLRVLVPVGSTDYWEIRQNLDRVKGERPDDAYLEVSILPKNRADRELVGRIVRLPDTDEKNVPIALTHRGGGSLATRPGGDPNVNQPLVQTYLIPIEIENPDATLAPGSLATVKIHLKWRSAAWWTWRSIASALNVGLW
jgi:putative peptide zinc metalloprotease protein